MKQILSISLAALLLFACQSNTEQNMSTLNLTQEWDKTFPKSELVNHCKVTFHNRYGIELAADMYVPKEIPGQAGNDEAVTPGRDRVSLPAIAVSGPFGAVKEQSSGLYAQHMAERGFVTVAFDPSYTGESGGEPRRMASPDINTEDFLAAVDFLANCDLVDPERIGIIGICGFGGMAVNAAALDPRINATVASTMYDMSKVNVEGYFASEDTPAQRMEKRKALAAQRTKDYASGTYERAGGVIDPLLNQPLLAWAGEIENPVLLIHGEKAHSRYFSEYAFSLLTGSNKELMIIPGASHVDLYDDVAGVIPYDKMEAFFKENLK